MKMVFLILNVPVTYPSLFPARVWYSYAHIYMLLIYSVLILKSC